MSSRTRNALLSLAQGKSLDPVFEIPQDSVLRDPKFLEYVNLALNEEWMTKPYSAAKKPAQDFINPKPENIFQVVYVKQ